MINIFAQNYGSINYGPVIRYDTDPWSKQNNFLSKTLGGVKASEE